MQQFELQGSIGDSDGENISTFEMREGVVQTGRPVACGNLIVISRFLHSSQFSLIKVQRDDRYPLRMHEKELCCGAL